MSDTVELHIDSSGNVPVPKPSMRNASTVSSRVTLDAPSRAQFAALEDRVAALEDALADHLGNCDLEDRVAGFKNPEEQNI